MIMIDFLASQKHYIDHIAPVWNRLPPDKRHNFYVPNTIVDYAQRKLQGASLYLFQYERVFPQDEYPILVAAYGDLIAAHRNNPHRKIFYMEHGTGHAFGTAAYPNGKGKRDYVSLFLTPNEYTKKLIQSVRDTPVEVIGTPKMDIYQNEFETTQRTISLIGSPSRPVLAIAFHWGDKHSVPPESGSAFEHYKDILPKLNDRYTLISHGHPIAEHFYRPIFQSMGIEWVETFDEVLQRADIYINDLSSTMYEFICTGKPVIVLNAPWFRRDVQWGIRFWDYSDVGINVESPEELFPAIEQTIEEYSSVHLPERALAVHDLYPYIGSSAYRAVDMILENI